MLPTIHCTSGDEVVLYETGTGGRPNSRSTLSLAPCHATCSALPYYLLLTTSCLCPRNCIAALPHPVVRVMRRHARWRNPHVEAGP